jgi:DNA-binding SARP family transcriptional activator
MGGLTIRTLGQLHFEQDGNLITDQLPVKGRALLVYLAVTGQTQTRETLAGLLWSEMPDEAARTNLRVMLSKLRKVVGAYLAISREMVGLVDKVWVDVPEFEKSAENTAVSFYAGDFLADFYVPDAPLFDEWVLIERERLRQIIINLLHTLVQQTLAKPELTDEGIVYARRILALDEWREEAHRQLMLLLARSGQRSAALAQFEQCRHILAEALGVEPSAATVALYEEIKVEGQREVGEERLRLQPEPRPTPHNLPAQTTPFIGRDEELAQIEELMAQAECRLLTLVGPGGMGKTRLSLQAAQLQLTVGGFGDGVFFVSLTAVTTPDFLITTIAQAVNFSFSGQLSPKEQLLNYLREKQLLLVLDNFDDVEARRTGLGRRAYLGGSALARCVLPSF